MRILILGGDGYLGWPTAMHLSAQGHDVVIADNYLRRDLARSIDSEMLYPVPNMHQRVARWKERSGKDIAVHVVDLADAQQCDALFAEVKPEALVHYAEQPSAPYSMLNNQAAGLTLHNNLGVTLNTILGVRDHCPDCHVIKLGTMGEYGTPNVDIPEGWFDLDFRGRTQRSLFPRQAGSLYHTTKIMDTDLLWFYCRVWNIRVTDLMQGPVYGLETWENEGDESLYPCFAYDEVFGTALNRFIVQAVAGYPLTVYGSGGQTRGYLNLKDTLNCIRLAVENPVEPGELRVFNQFTEMFSVNELADRVQRIGGTLGLNVEIKNLPNPRIEAEDHYYNPDHTGLTDLGLEPHLLTDERLAAMIDLVRRHAQNINHDQIFRGVTWASKNKTNTANPAGASPAVAAS